MHIAEEWISVHGKRWKRHLLLLLSCWVISLHSKTREGRNLKSWSFYKTVSFLLFAILSLINQLSKWFVGWLHFNLGFLSLFLTLLLSSDSKYMKKKNGLIWSPTCMCERQKKLPSLWSLSWCIGVVIVLELVSLTTRHICFNFSFCFAQRQEGLFQLQCLFLIYACM